MSVFYFGQGKTTRSWSIWQVIIRRKAPQDIVFLKSRYAAQAPAEWYETCHGQGLVPPIFLSRPAWNATSACCGRQIETASGLFRLGKKFELVPEKNILPQCFDIEIINSKCIPCDSPPSPSGLFILYLVQGSRDDVLTR